jgi:hypothetical protein
MPQLMPVEPPLCSPLAGIIDLAISVISSAEPAGTCFPLRGKQNKDLTAWLTILIARTIGWCPPLDEKYLGIRTLKLSPSSVTLWNNTEVEEVYWVGGEPLMYEQHWRYMKRIVELGDGPRLYARYNTNLSRVEYKGISLYRDILSNIRDWQICASLDGTDKIGEYIRTGLDYEQFIRNFEHGLEYATNPRQMRLDFTLTLPGMFEVGAMERLSQKYGVQLLAKVIFSFTPDIVMSPLALPRELLDDWIDELVLDSTSGAMRDVLLQLKTRPTFEQQWPDQYRAGLVKGKARVLKLESIRTQAVTMTDILSQRPQVLEWWNQIA